MKKNLLATLADKNYIDQAKQLFSSVYWNAGWKGDYMLLAHEIPEKDLKWFRDKGILVKKCKPIAELNFGKWPSTVCSKFYLFTPYSKKWKNIVFLDADIIVRGSLERLTKIKGFAAVKGYRRLCNLFKKPMESYFLNLSETYKKLQRNYNLNKQNTFNTGVFAFSTRIISAGSFDRLKSLYQSYGAISNSAEEAILNLLFYDEDIEFFPSVYNRSSLFFFKNIILKKKE
jgi:lipopolysaccharide biosynthesis glycosyltransferase